MSDYSYDYKYDTTYCYPEANVLKNKLNIGHRAFGTNQYVIDIEVNDKNGLAIDRENIIEKPRKEINDKLTLQQKKLIYGIFCKQKIINNNFQYALSNKGIFVKIKKRRRTCQNNQSDKRKPKKIALFFHLYSSFCVFMFVNIC